MLSQTVSVSMFCISNSFHKHVTKRWRAITVEWHIATQLSSILVYPLWSWLYQSVTQSHHHYYYKSRSLRNRKLNLFHSPRLYHTSISPLSVRTSMIVWPRKSSDSRLNFCLTRDLMSSSSSHTRTFIRSEELWHSLKTHIRPGLSFSYTTRYLLSLKLV